ncbi:MAG TPA: hypothetical protein VLS89_20635, partial [Candidatus Nanopelagicales bacterium]|nr:hypothetical protein [Candidatus Nanopelagicales bacterium]
MASDELDALLESVGPGVDGVTAALSAKDISRLLAARAAGFGKTGRRSESAAVTDNAPTAPPPPPSTPAPVVVAPPPAPVPRTSPSAAPAPRTPPPPAPSQPSQLSQPTPPPP